MMVVVVFHGLCPTFSTCSEITGFNNLTLSGITSWFSYQLTNDNAFCPLAVIPSLLLTWFFFFPSKVHSST
ncbi:hypothetical protein F5146DRAFT_1065190 [Armillaria mellea]|nr:hypothetical protein F5146DRAFT_1065190 [Armillaria mellea]